MIGEIPRSPEDSNQDILEVPVKETGESLSIPPEAEQQNEAMQDTALNLGDTKLNISAQEKPRPVTEERIGEEILRTKRNAALKLLEAYKEGNQQELDIGRNKELDEALDSLKGPEKSIELAEYIIGRIIKGRTERAKEAFDSRRMEEWKSADDKILEYISKLVPDATEEERNKKAFLKDNRISIFENYLEVAENIKDGDEQAGARELREQIEKLKSGTVPGEPEKPKSPEAEETLNDIDRKTRYDAEAWLQKGINSGEIKTKEQFVAERDGTILSRMWKENFDKAYSQLSPRQQEGFNALRADSKILKESQAENLLTSGLSLSDIKNIKYNHWFSSKIKSKLSDGKAVSEDDFDKLVKAKIDEKIAELMKQAKKEVEELYEEKRAASIAQFIKNAEAQKLLREQQAAKREAEKQAREEKEKRSEAEKQAKIEKAQQIPGKERLKSLNELRKKWDEAILKHSKIKEIERALKKGEETGEYKIRGVKGLTLEEAKAKIEEFKNELADKNTKRSDEIIDIADMITGRNLRKEAKERASGKGEKGRDLVWLTKEVQKIYKEQIKQLGKKGKVPAIKANRETLTPMPPTEEK
ncbi:MAG: hypothetical protein US31_C0016G0001 [Berkelbacteria bacterium GW2011_GWA1_36_9]|uniref:Uncharacterized protein n=1 Tax=Berkelbacteria bacterium GW2011_GWA1_36_9 TaxID=1618331 RepID=A0A0G0I0L0_9BACT|nr:MAG: hypothetical protein US31_C0016G0001 [Berkelbacteria bacterium GW2011_GWA1_36_9]